MKKIFLLFLFFSLLNNSSLVFGLNLETKLVTWSELRKLNYKTGEMPANLRQLIGKSVKIPGFAVPLEGDGGFDYIKEFLLVPTYGMCVHVPPPPPNQVIHVILDKPEHFEKFLYAVWITGILEIGEYYIEGSSDSIQQIYDTESSYLIRGLKVEEYD
jgi:uncharacterized protein